MLWSKVKVFWPLNLVQKTSFFVVACWALHEQGITVISSLSEQFKNTYFTYRQRWASVEASVVESSWTPLTLVACSLQVFARFCLGSCAPLASLCSCSLEEEKGRDPICHHLLLLLETQPNGKERKPISSAAITELKAHLSNCLIAYMMF